MHIPSASWRLRLLLASLTALAAAGCTPETLPVPGQSYQRTIEPSGLVLFSPPHYSVTVTAQAGHKGFHLEDAQRELVAAVVRTSASRLGISPYANEDFTAPAFAQRSISALLTKVKRDMTQLLPNAGPEGVKWSVVRLKEGLTTDRQGGMVGYGHYKLIFGPGWQPRSYDLLHYLSKVYLGADWGSFPKDKEKYYPPGASELHFVIAFALHAEDGFFTGDGNDNQERIDLALAAMPHTQRAAEWIAQIDDVLAFKTLGDTRDTLEEETRSFVYEKRGPPVDIVIAIDSNATMSDEMPAFKVSLGDFIRRISTDAAYDYRIAIVTNREAALIKLADQKLYIDPDSSNPEGLLSGALDKAWKDVGNGTVLRNEQLKFAIQSLDDPRNEGFRRSEAPAILVSITDRDDESFDLEESPLTSAESYGQWLHVFSYWVPIFPSNNTCDGSAGAGNMLRNTAMYYGAQTFDLCGLNHFSYVAAVLDNAARFGARFRYPVPQPLPFTMQAKLNGVPLAASPINGFTYDFLGDRLLVAGAVELAVDDVIETRYMVLRSPPKR
jgi:hypothetical protein